MVARVGGPVAPYVEFCWLNDSYQLTIHPMIPAAEAFVPRFEEEVQVIEMRARKAGLAVAACAKLQQA